MDDLTTGWTRGIGLLDPYGYLMSIAADAENRADELDAAMATVEAEIGVDAFAADAPIRAASWSDKLRARARRLRADAVAHHATAAPSGEETP